MVFAVYCVELYRNRHGMSGSQVMDLFMDRGLLEYVIEHHEVLHVLGDACILDDLESLIADGGYDPNGPDRL